MARTHSWQERSGQRLGEILIARGYASRVAIMDALIQQAGLLLESEKGFGTGLREQIERQHRRARGRLGPGEVDDAVGGLPPGSEPTDSSDLAAALQEQIAEAAAPTMAEPSDSACAQTPADEFHAAVERARSHLAARRAELPTPTHARSVCEPAADP